MKTIQAMSRKQTIEINKKATLKWKRECMKIIHKYAHWQAIEEFRNQMADATSKLYKELYGASKPVMHVGKEFQELGNIPEKG
jgi:hypothetical protein